MPTTVQLVAPLSAQRLSASLRWAHFGCEVEVISRGPCSTPFGITEVGTILWGIASDGDNPCSTPFGITEVGTSGFRCPLGGSPLCSTPFGITEVGTRDQSFASTPRYPCSTPFGITEVGTRRNRSHTRPDLTSAQRLSASLRWARRWLQRQG